MEPRQRLLTHPFYEAWERGDVTREQLSAYAAAYQALMDRIPDYWDRVLSGLSIDDPRGRTIVEEEREHAALWADWRAALPAAADHPALTDLLSALEGMGPAELAGALHAYEVQQPAVAETKRAGLVEHYGFDAGDLAFFDEHVTGEDEHIAFGKRVREEFADPAAFDRGFRRGADRLYHSLDAFVAA